METKDLKETLEGQFELLRERSEISNDLSEIALATEKMIEIARFISELWE
ncbi:hypothetical protein [Christensenella intestinihominis]|nr:hypothetical protein [Christensenella intestinihominis]